MIRMRALVRETRGAAAAEMAMVLPILLFVLVGSMELGHYFHSEHILVKALRDGARYAARQDLSLYESGTGTATTCNATPEDPIVADTRELVMTSLLTGTGGNRLSDWSEATITVSVECSTMAGTETLAGIYEGRSVGAPVVRVAATVPYVPIIGAPLGFSGLGLDLDAAQEAVVTGL